MARNCTEITPKLYFDLDELLSSSLGDSNSNYNQVLNRFKDKVKAELGITASDAELKDFIKFSSLNTNLINNILNSGSSSSPEPSQESQKPPVRQFTEQEEVSSGYGEDVDKELDDYSSYTYQTEVIERKLVDTIYNKKLNSLNDLHLNYFNGALMTYDFFASRFSNKIFNASFVSFEKGMIVENQQQLNENINDYRNEVLEELKKYFPDIPTEALQDHKKLVDYLDNHYYTSGFSNKSLSALTAKSPDNPELNAYLNYVTIKHFDELISLLLDNIKVNKSLKSNYSGDLSKKYSVSLSHKTINNFSDSWVNILDEVNGLTRKMISYTPIIGLDGKIKPGKYLKMGEVNTLAMKLKSQSKPLNGSMDFRLNPQLKIKELIKNTIITYINNNGKTDGDFRKADIDTLITVYNYYYKTDEDLTNPKFKGLFNDTTKSLLKIKMEMFKKAGFIHENVIMDSITTQLDKTISQKYMSLQETRDGMNKLITKDQIINNYVARTKSNLNNNSNQGSSTVDNDFEVVKQGDNLTQIVKLKDPIFKGIPLINVFDENNPSLGSFKVQELDVDDWSNFLSNNFKSLNDDQKRFATLVQLASDFAGLNLTASNGELILAMSKMDAETIAQNLLGIISKMAYAKKLHNEFKLQSVENTANEGFRDFVDRHLPIEIKLNDYMNGESIAPFKKTDKLNAFINTYGEAKAISKGDVSKAISRNRNNDGLPNASLYNLIGDDHTTFTKIFKSPDSDSTRKNLFGFVQNNVGIIEDTIYRTDIEMMDGSIKNVKNFNSSEIATQGIFHDFLLSAAIDGKVLMEPTVFADKVGQAMKLFNINKKLKYEVNGKTYEGTVLELYKQGNLRTLHYQTMREQYKAMHDKLIKDYQDIFNFILKTNPQELNIAGLENKITDNVNSLTISDFDLLLKQNKNIKLEDYSNATGRRIEIQQEFHYTKSGVNGLLLKNFKQYAIGQFEDAKWDPNYKKTGQTYYERRMNREDKKFIRAMRTLGVTIQAYNEFDKINPDYSKILDYYLDEMLGLKNDSKERAEAKVKFEEKWINNDGTLKLHEGNSLTEDDVYNPDVTVNVNPLFEFFYQSHQLLNGNYNLAVVGGAHGHVIKISRDNELKEFTPPKKGETNSQWDRNKQKFITNYLTPDEIWEEIEESARTIAMHKRMVAYQAKLHPFSQNLITGVPYNMKMAVVKDVEKTVFNSVGDSDDFKVADGAAWIPMVAAVKFRDSLADTGTDTATFKAIRHDLDTDTSVAHLDKYAIQALSNERMRKSEGSMMPLSWMNKRALATISLAEVMDGNTNILASENQLIPHNEDHIFTINNSQLGDLSKLKLPNYISSGKIMYVLPGTNTYVETKGMAYNSDTNEYVILQEFNNFDGTKGFPIEPNYVAVDKNKGLYYKSIPINNLHDLWNGALGGMYSIGENPHSDQFKIGDRNYSYSEDSHQALSRFMDNVARKKNDNNNGLIDQDNYHQPLKDALIWQINNTSGMKNGAKNVNGTKLIETNPDTNPIGFNYFVTTSTNYGIQGNFDHIYDEEHEARVTEGSQMISLAAGNGYLTNDVDRLYKSLATVVKNSLAPEYKALLKGNDAVILMLTKTLIKTLNTKDRLGLAQAYGVKVQKELDRLLKKDPNLSTMIDSNFKLAFSDPNFYSAMVSMVSGAFNSRAIKRDLPGLGAILSQCHNSMTIMETPDGKIITPDVAIHEKIKELLNSYGKGLSEGNEDAINAFNKDVNDFKTALQTRRLENSTIPMHTNSIHAFDTYRVKDYVFEISDAIEYYNIKENGVLGIKGAKLGDFNQVILPNGDSVLAEEINVINKVKYAPRNLQSRYFKFIDDNNTVELNEMDLYSSKLAWAYLNFIKDKKVFGPNKDLLNNYLISKGTSIEALIEASDKEKDAIKQQIIKNQQAEHDLLHKQGLFTYGDGQVYKGKATVYPGEIILPNYNAHKFGLSEGMQVSDVTVDYFLNRFSKIHEPNNQYSEFYFTVRDGNHVNFLSEDNWKSASYLSLTKIDKSNLKFRDGKYYLTDANGETMFEVTDNLEVYSTGENKDSGTIFVKYKNLEDIKKVSDSSYFVGLNYNTNNFSTSKISNYIKSYDFKNSRYLNAKGEFDNIKYSSNEEVTRRANKLAKSLMNSFNEQLKVIGTRIPSQAFQSVMAMKIVAFTDKGVNTAYVPVKKNYLDGSDFDIDKIYMTGRSVGRNGRYNGWSPYFNHADIETSSKLPFPDGKPRKSEIKNTTNSDDIVDITNDEYKALDAYVKSYIMDEDDSEEALAVWPIVVETLNKLANKSIYSVNGQQLDDLEENKHIKQFISNYFEDTIKDEETLLEASKNAVSDSLFNISNALVNSMASDRGVDMNDPKDGAKKSPKTWQSKQFSMDNYATLPLMKEENGAGKAVIGIAAVATKVFFALSQHYNQQITKIINNYNPAILQEAIDNAAINSKDGVIKSPLDYLNSDIIQNIEEDLRKIMNPKSFDFYDESNGTTKRIITTYLANVNLQGNKVIEEISNNLINKIREEYSEGLQDSGINELEVLDGTTLKDTSLTLSALLSAATDNAKELILAKINAGPELAGTYAYMIIQGIAFDDITNFMVSPTVDAIVAKSKPNIFNKNKSNIKTSISYFLDGVDHRNYLNQSQWETLNYYITEPLTKAKFDQMQCLHPIWEDDITQNVDKTEQPEKAYLVERYNDLVKNPGNYKINDYLIFTLNPSEAIRFLKESDGTFSPRSISWALRGYAKAISEDNNISLSVILRKIVKNDNGVFDSTPMKREGYVQSDDSYFEEFDYMFDDPFEEENDYYKPNNGLNQALNKFINEVNSRVILMHESKFSVDKAIEFARIYEESDEITNFGARLGINGGMKTDVAGHMNYNYKMSNYFYNKLALLPDKPDKARDFHPLADFFKLKSFSEMAKDFSTTEALRYVTDLENFSKQHYDENSEEYKEHQKYRKAVIDLYDIVKSKFNVIEAEAKLPHFSSMIGVHATALDVFDSNIKYNYTRKLTKSLQDKGFIPYTFNNNYSNFDEDQLKKIGHFITSDLVNIFFDSNNLSYVIPANTNYYDDHFNLVKSTSPKRIYLNTQAGRATFKIFMEEYLLEKWKKDPNFVNNKFIENLTFDESKDPITGKPYSYIKLDLDMLNIKSDSEKIAFQEYSMGYSDLKNYIDGGVKVSDLFVIYNLLIHNNSFGKDNFTKIFEGELDNSNENLITKYLQFIGDVDQSITNTGRVDYDYKAIQYERLALSLAKTVTSNEFGQDHGKYVKVYNPENQSYDIYSRDVDLESGKYTYTKYDIKTIQNVPSKLYLTDTSINPLSSNNLYKQGRFTEFKQAHTDGNINILIEC